MAVCAQETCIDHHDSEDLHEDDRVPVTVLTGFLAVGGIGNIMIAFEEKKNGKKLNKKMRFSIF